MKTKLEIHQKKIKGCEDSFWYDGLIASIGNYRLIATGDIRINKKGGDIAYSNGKFYDYMLEKKVRSDKTLEKYVGQNYSDPYYWENNNWFEVIYASKVVDGVTFIEDCDLGIVEYDYASAIRMLKAYAKEDTFNQKKG